MHENKNHLSIEEVDEKVWEQVSKAAPPQKSSFGKGIKIAVYDLSKKFGIEKEKSTSRKRKGKFKLAYSFLFAAFVVASFAFKVKGHAKYADLVTFELAKKTYLSNHQKNVDKIFAAFSRIDSPMDSNSYFFIKYIRENNGGSGKIVDQLKITEGVSHLAINPLTFEIWESLFSSFFHHAFEIELTKANPSPEEIKDKIKGVLNEKGLNAVEIQITDESHDILFRSHTADQQAPLPNAKDPAVIRNAVTANPKIIHTTDTNRNPPLDPPSFETDLQLMSVFTNALEKDGLVNNKKPYKLEIKDGEFYINDKKQPKEVTEKFRKYFRNDNYTITNDGDASPSNHSEIPKDKPKIGSSHLNSDMPKFDPVQYQKDLKLMNLLIDGLVKDGLIDRNRPYTIQVKEGELYINSKKQPKEVSEKFRKYFSGNNYGFVND